MQRSSFWSEVLGLALLIFLASTGSLAQPAAAQTAEPDENELATYYSLYYEDFRNENYEQALPNLRWILEHAPGYRGPNREGSDINFSRMVDLWVNLAEQAETDEEKRARLDSALVYADQAVPTLENEGVEVDEYRWKLEKGRLIQANADVLGDRMDEALQAYRDAYELAPDRIDPYYLDRIVRAMVREDRREEAIAFLDDVEQRRGEQGDVQDFLDDWRDRLFRTPEERIAFLEDRVERNPDDVELLTELFDLYIRHDHEDEASRLAERLMELDPTPRVYRLIGRMRLDDGEPEKAFELYEQAVELADEPSAELYYNMGIAQQQMDQLSRARQYFREALEVNPEFGQAYISIGDLYARAVSQCSGAEMSRDDRAVYWLVTDYYERAREVDPSVSNTAQQKITTYRQYYPSSEAIFFRDDWEIGQSHHVGGGCYSWIDETTTVKSP